MFRGDWGNATNKQMPRIGNTDSWHFCEVWPHLPCLQKSDPKNIIPNTTHGQNHGYLRITQNEMDEAHMAMNLF